MLHTVLTACTGEQDWDQTLAKYAQGTLKHDISMPLRELLEKYKLVALEMHNFYRHLQKDKSTIYPSQKLDGLLRGIR